MTNFTEEEAVWRVNQNRSFVDARFFVDFVSDTRKGIRVMVADKLTQEQAESLVLSHNLMLAKEEAAQ